jgi:hypothetical protein
MVESGRAHHIAGLANIIRKLVATGDPLPHLQVVAAAKGVPLIVYTDRRPVHLEDEALEQLSFSIWSKPNGNEDNPIDLDVWLDLNCGLVAGRPVSNRDMLTKIGDTIGAHFDIDLHDNLLMLRSYESALSGTNRSFLLEYLTRVAHAVADLTEATMSTL